MNIRKASANDYPLGNETYNNFTELARWMADQIAKSQNDEATEFAEKQFCRFYVTQETTLATMRNRSTE